MGRTSRRRFQRQPNGLGNLVIADLTWPPRTRFIQETVNSSFRKAAPPFRRVPGALSGSDTREPVEALLAVERLWERVGHLDGGNPLGVLETQLGGGAQPQWKAERI